jgi:small subunit ribosomal protein S4
LFERRLDNVVFKIGLAGTRAQARQFVTHGHITVNGKKVSIPSYLVEKDDVIGVSKREKTQKLIKACLEDAKGRAAPSWIVVDGQSLTGKILSFPVREDISLPVNEQLIVELLSR